jgi:hypothetical protein
MGPDFLLIFSWKISTAVAKKVWAWVPCITIALVTHSLRQHIVNCSTMRKLNLQKQHTVSCLCTCCPPPVLCVHTWTQVFGPVYILWAVSV